MERNGAAAAGAADGAGVMPREEDRMSAMAVTGYDELKAAIEGFGIGHVAATGAYWHLVAELFCEEASGASRLQMWTG